MEATTQSHNKMLKRIFLLCQVFGWMIIAFGMLMAGILLWASQGIIELKGMRHIVEEGSDVIQCLLMGCIVLLMVQFVRYVMDEERPLSTMLRKGHYIIGLFAVSLFLSGCLRMWPHFLIYCDVLLNPDNGSTIFLGRELGYATGVVIYFASPVIKALCILALAAMLRMVLPVLTESKTLV